jgi:peptidoglycan/LPS O-acetylase OafA/YrhL
MNLSSAATRPVSASAISVRPADQNPHYILGYNPRLDGLRGIATLCVLLYHYFIPGFTAGLYGLDIFFVLSGYLITKLLLKFESDGRSLGQFYWNRFLRLMPALAVLCISIIVLSLVFPWLFDRQVLVDDIVSSFLYVANWTRAFSLHLPAYLGNCWSLAVEEQFYLLWPCLCLILLRKGASRSFEFSLCLLAFFVAWPFWLEAHHVTYDRLANGFDTRCGGLLFGCCLALSEKRAFGVVFNGMLSRLWPLAALAFATLVFLTPDGWSPTRGLIANLSAVSLIAAAYRAPNSLIGRLMNLRPAIFVGKISYSLYLWHYPVMLVLYLHQISKTEIAAIGLPLSFLLGLLSYRYVEQPALRLRYIEGVPLRSFGLAAAFFSAFGMLAAGTYFFHDQIRDQFSFTRSAALTER